MSKSWSVFNLLEFLYTWIMTNWGRNKITQNKSAISAFLKSLKKKKKKVHNARLTPVTAELCELRQEETEFEDNMACKRPCLKNWNKNKTEK